MNNQSIKALGISTKLTILLITIMTILGELNSKFKDFLTGLTGHHWTAKGLISLIFFILIYLLFNKASSKKEDIKKVITVVMWYSIAGALIIFLFYVYEFFA